MAAGYPGDYPVNPCLLVAKMNWCRLDIFSGMCCYTCKQFTSGELFESDVLDLPTETDDNPWGYDDYDAEYGGDYSYEDEDGDYYIPDLVPLGGGRKDDDGEIPATLESSPVIPGMEFPYTANGIKDTRDNVHSKITKDDSNRTLGGD